MTWIHIYTHLTVVFLEMFLFCIWNMYRNMILGIVRFILIYNYMVLYKFNIIKYCESYSDISYSFYKEYSIKYSSSQSYTF